MKKLNKVLLGLTSCTFVVPTATITSCSKPKVSEFKVEIVNGGYDQNKSALELDKDSTIQLLVEQEKSIKSIKKVQVGDTVLHDGYTFNVETYMLTIPAKYMKSTMISIVLEIENIFDVNIYNEGCYYDPTKSFLSLGTESTIVLGCLSTKQIDGVKYIIVGDQTLTTEFTFDKANSTITIPAKYMTSTFIYIVLDMEQQYITWSNGWYVWECETTGYVKSNTIDVEFELANSLEDGQELTYTIERIEAESDKRVQLVEGTKTILDKTVTIPMCLQSNESSFIYFGNHVTYNITFTCKSGDTKVWEQKIEECYLYALVELIMDSKYKDLSTKSSADITLEHEISVSQSYTGFRFDTRIETTDRSEGMPNDVEVVPDGTLVWTLIKDFKQTVKWSSTTGITEGAWAKYKLIITLTCLKYPERPVKFEFKELKLTYK